MPDLLVKLYDLPPIDGKLESLRSEEIRLRPAMAYEKHQVVGWVTKHFSDGWASECDVAFSNSPISCHIATKDGAILGFACYDSTSRGMFGPFGVAESARGQGIGRRLLLSSLEAMKAAGYAYAVIGNARSVEYYSHIINIVEIPDSSPGIYLDRLAR